MAKLYVIMGKSSTGKDTVYKEIMKNKDFFPITMYTTRPMRDGEKEGREYFFTNEKAVEEYEKQGKIIEMREYNTVYGIWKYFTLDDGQIEAASEKKYVIIATLEAYKKYLDYYGNEMVCPIYIEVDDKTRIHRAIAREEMQDVPKYAEMCRRYLADEEDFSEEKIKNLNIYKKYINYDLDTCVCEIVRDML